MTKIGCYWTHWAWLRPRYGYLAIDFIHDTSFIHYFSFFPEFSFQRKSLTFICHLRHTKIFRENPKGFQRSFLAYYMRWRCMRTERYYEMSLVIPSTIFETVAKVKQNTITFMTSVVNDNLTVKFSENASKTHHFFSSKFDIHGNANAGHACCRGHELPYKTNVPYEKAHIVLQLVIICCFTVIFTVCIRYRGVGWSRFV